MEVAPSHGWLDTHGWAVYVITMPERRDAIVATLEALGIRCVEQPSPAPAFEGAMAAIDPWGLCLGAPEPRATCHGSEGAARHTQPPKLTVHTE